MMSAIIFITFVILFNECTGFKTLLSSKCVTTSKSSLAAIASPSLPVESLSPVRAQRVTVLLSELAISPFTIKPSKSPVPWLEVFNSICSKMEWESQNNKYDLLNGEKLKVNVISMEEAMTLDSSELAADIIVLVGLSDLWTSSLDDTMQQKADALVNYVADKCIALTHYDCTQSYADLEKYGSFIPSKANNNFINTIEDVYDGLLKTKRNEHRKTAEITTNMWERMSLDDLIFMLFVLVDSFANYPIKSVQSVTSSDETSLEQLGCMCSKCSQQMIDCFQDETCRKALSCLDKCKGNDQVCQYKCITSYETEKFEKFALCILQRNNCMGNFASIPVYPDPSPLASFRGMEMTFETAEDIFIGHLQMTEGYSDNPLMTNAPELLPWSWKVVCGQNPAYDYFACQHQLFYRDRKNPSTVWYDPVFKVTTLGGDEVWRRRHYRVRRGKVPGQFFLSVLDNGVVSSEFWRILDCAEDMSWAVFYYGGAASAAGTSYSGALVVSPDGQWPDMTPATSARIEKALATAEITMWELYEVENDCCNAVAYKGNDPPLDLP